MPDVSNIKKSPREVVKGAKQVLETGGNCLVPQRSDAWVWDTPERNRTFGDSLESVGCHKTYHLNHF